MFIKQSPKVHDGTEDKRILSCKIQRQQVKPMSRQAFLKSFRVQGQTSQLSGMSTSSTDGLVHNEDLGKDTHPHLCKRQVSLSRYALEKLCHPHPGRGSQAY